MKALRDAIQDHQQVENSSPFINEDSPEQNAYTNAVQQAEALINQVDHPTLIEHKFNNLQKLLQMRKITYTVMKNFKMINNKRLQI